jgi:PhnB protein
MTAPVPYVLFDGTARAAFTFYQGVFGGELTLHSYADFGRDDGPSDAVAHGYLTGPVAFFGADAGPADEPVSVRGLLFSALGAAAPDELEAWFAALSDGGTVVDPLQKRPWGAHDGTVTDRYGLTWLIGYEE